MIWKVLKKGDDWWINSPEHGNNGLRYITENSHPDGTMKDHKIIEIAPLLDMRMFHIYNRIEYLLDYLIFQPGVCGLYKGIDDPNEDNPIIGECESYEEVDDKSNLDLD